MSLEVSSSAHPETVGHGNLTTKKPKPRIFKTEAEFFNHAFEKNRLLNKDAPLMLVLMSPSENGSADAALSNPVIHRHLLQAIHKGNKIALATLKGDPGRTGEEIREEMEKALLAHGELGIVVFLTHGLPGGEGLLLGSNTVYRAPDLRAEHFSAASPHTTFAFWGCETAPFAKELSRITGKRVLAPEDPLEPIEACLHKCPQHGWELFSYNMNDAQHGRIFEHDQENLPCPIDREPLDDLKEYLLYWAKKGDAHAQYYLGICYADRRGFASTESKKEALKVAIKWLRLSAKQGHAKAMRTLLDFYEKGLGGIKAPEALQLYKKAAEQGDDDAAYRLGSLHEAKGELAEAFALCDRAARNGHEKAAYKLGMFYENGISGHLVPSEVVARRCYQFAADAGNTEAQEALKRLNASESA